MKKTYTYHNKAFISIALLVIFTIYLSLLFLYTVQYTVKLKTLNNLEMYYNNQIIETFKKGR
ncbi:hypothetical protein HMPREF2693_02180 [Staphylococcus sp. HMSC068D08]|uniref:Uncharacterized protein n=1 Tax=Staphylococcus lugdunensis TaxID=28035 RepID=A0A133Q266_STALU|nr:hypothetical protein AL499_01240 [Staphylococcus lugdunensis]EFU84838.1 hypothetical protein HMPREF0790_0270 [Staphylococcus lugdunensis M23590]EKS25522.1 hypothetical protein HMPREF9308_00373 [Staphylococcus lugdunensis ACS-027-V-Sch2]EVI52312.1 hypothetical protein T979_00707 [Staphylococcus lugdunensis UCIM6116]OFJ64540.1 hypothetical protein HMPREF2855_06805 [Staphylococcus sp. HMSC077E11]OFK09342.1 hypothetical protein HMPREF2831_09775 [Staphylococcus sp. HMSC065E07]OFM43817.1 hypothe